MKDWGSDTTDGRLGRVQRQMGYTAAFVVAVVALGIAAPSSASSTTTSTLTATATGGGGWCCGTFVFFEGSGVFASAGRVKFTGERLRGCFIVNFEPLLADCLATISLDFVSPNGDTLSIRGTDTWTLPDGSAPQVLSWSVTGGTGRFSGHTWSGTYTFTFTETEIVISLTFEK
jgi:hypothetical protein